MKTLKRNRWKIFVGPVEIAGIAEELVTGFSKIDIYAKTIFSIVHPFNYGESAPECSPTHWILRVWQKFGALRAATPRENFFKKIIYVGLHNYWGWVVFFKVIFSFNVFIFLYGQTITNSILELWLLKALKKKIIFTYVGSDIRPPYIDGGMFPASDPVPSTEFVYALTKKRKRKVEVHEKYADYLINSPSTAQFHQRRYINWFLIGIPKSIESVTVNARPANNLIRVLHSPSNPAVKGSSQIKAVIENIKNEGIPLELITVQNVPNKTVLTALAECDFVVDQLYSDSPLAVFAVEAAFFGKPAIVGGYFSEKVNSYLRAQDMPPSLFVLPEQIEEAVKQMATDERFRFELGEKAKQFVTNRWSSISVAKKYEQLLEGDFPAEWWCDPQLVDYTGGCGMPWEHAQKIVTNMIKLYGVKSLRVSDKPKLEQAFMHMAAKAIDIKNA